MQLTARCVDLGDARVDVELAPTATSRPRFEVSAALALAVLRASGGDGTAMPFDIARSGYVGTRNWVPRLWRVDERTGFHEGLGLPDSHPLRAWSLEHLAIVYDETVEGPDYLYADDFPHATLRIEVTDARLLAHLEVGLEWELELPDDDTAPLLL